MSFPTSGKSSASTPRIPAGGRPAGRNVDVRLSAGRGMPVTTGTKEGSGGRTPLDQAYWRAPEGSGGCLRYLSWGARHFGSTSVVQARPGGWSYVVVEAGSPTLVWGGRREQVRGPALVLIGPDCELGWRDGSPQENKHLMWVWRRPVHAVMTRLRSDAMVHYALEAPDVSELRHLHALSRGEIFRGDVHSEAALSGLQSLLEARIARIGEGCTGDPRKETVERALHWIEVHVAARQPLARLADFLGVSPATVQRLFRERLGTTVMKSVAEHRRREAERMLRSDGASIKEIAYRLGYRHPHDFSRAFRNHTGKLPSDWAARMEASS